MKNLSSVFKELKERYQARYRSFQPKDITIHADQNNSAVTSFYKSRRENMSSKRKHLLRKKLIFKILRGKLIVNEENEIAEFLIKELIGKGHLPDDSLPRPKIQEVQEIIDKFVSIVGHTSEGGEEKSKKQLQRWLLNITAWEIEDALKPHEEKVLVEYMSRLVASRTEISSKELSEQEKNIQAFIASQKSLFDPDKYLLAYYLLTKKVPNWKNPSQEQLINITTDIYSIWKEVRRDLANPFHRSFRETCKKLTPCFLLLEKILKKNDLEENIKEPKWLEERLEEAYQQAKRKLNKNLFRITISSALVIFLLKLFLFLGVEVPFTNFPLTLNAVAINLLAPAVLMFLLGFNIRPPQEENFNLISLEVMKIVYGQENQEAYSVKKIPRSFSKRSMIFLYYLLTFLILAGMIIMGLSQLNFPLLSHVIFLIFISLISFVSIQMQKRAERIRVRRGGSLLRDILKSFSFPLEIITPINHFLTTLLESVTVVPPQDS